MANVQICVCASGGENDNGGLMVLSDSREVCKSKITAQGTETSSGTQDRRTDTDNVKIKFMVSLQWFPSL